MRRLPLALVLAAAIGALAPAAASAARQPTTGPCGVGAQSPQCYFWTGKVTFIADADTLSVRLAGDKGATRIRVTGINATEEYVHTNTADDRVGECHAGEATDRLEKLVSAAKGNVRLAAQDPASHSGSRVRRAVAVKINGRWRDVGRTLLNEGHAIWLSNGTEWAWNASYSIIAQRAADRGVGIWDPAYCAPGPDQTAKLKLWVNTDAPGTDAQNPNGEWVRIKNLDSSAIDVGGWWVRDSDLRRYALPLGTVIPPDTTITIFVGRGTNTATDLFWGLGAGIFDNGTYSRNGSGDGAYLFDQDGDLRESMQVPCRWHCSDPLEGKLKLDAHPDGTEYVDVTNKSGDRVGLEGYRLAAGGNSYAFGSDWVLSPGESVRLFVKGDPATDTRDEKHWGIDRAILPNAGGKVNLTTFTYIDLSCTAWGTTTC